VTPLASRVLGELPRRALVASGDRVMVALSGGPDSVALTLILLEVLPAIGASVAATAHLHHGLRGPDADADESFCRAFAARLGLACVVEHADAAGTARAERVSIEVAGHRLRDEFFERARRQVGATLVATGHTRNDLAETFLLRALRGAGLRGLGGIRVRRGRLIRPLLNVSRAEVLEFLAARAQPYREDASNRDRQIIRNRVRQELVPWLEAHVSPRAVDALARTARIAADDDACLRQLSATHAGRLLAAHAHAIDVEQARLLELPVALRRRVVLEALERLSRIPPAWSAVESVVGLAEGWRRGPLRLSGLRVTLEAGRLVFRAVSPGREPPPQKARQGPLFTQPLEVPGVVRLPGGGRIESSRHPAPGPRLEPAGPDVAKLDAARVREPLRVRYRRPGDRLRPLGMAGRKKLQDLLVDRKIPRHERDFVPLVVDADDRLLWVAGLALADDARVTSATTGVLLLKYWR
jgi:tRNA(Ile)-lysidine synthase